MVFVGANYPTVLFRDIIKIFYQFAAHNGSSVRADATGLQNRCDSIFSTLPKRFDCVLPAVR
jgi:hypothetical protein